MVWKTKTSLAELLRRRKQTLQEWMSQMGMEKLDDIAAWCDAHDAVVDIDLPAVMKPQAPKVLPKPQAQLAVETVKELVEPVIPKFEVVAVETSVVKKVKVSKKEENDPSSGSE